MSKIQSFNIALTNENAFLPDLYLENCKAHSQVNSIVTCHMQSFLTVSHVFLSATYYT